MEGRGEIPSHPIMELLFIPLAIYFITKRLLCGPHIPRNPYTGELEP